jgi:MoaA/NifB/PqqE/SkfB family radical SAM enzyme
MKKQSAAFILTNRCTAACDICCLNCSPECEDIMPEELMLGAIDGLKNFGGFKFVGFSGGEPFLYPELLKKGMKYAFDAGFLVSAASNGFWGAWSKEEIKSFFEDLKTDGITLSTDSAHAQFVSDEAFGHAVVALKELEITFAILLGENKAGLSAREQFNVMGNYKYSTQMTIEPHVRAGKAAKLPEDAFYRYEPLEKARCSERGMISIRYDGEVFPCCSPYIFDTQLSLGNLNKKNITEILTDKNNNYFYTALKNGALPYLAGLAKERYNINFPEFCTDGCEVCARLFGDCEHFNEWLSETQDWYSRFAADRLLMRGGEST